MRPFRRLGRWARNNPEHSTPLMIGALMALGGVLVIAFSVAHS